MVKCTFCRYTITPGTGKIFAMNDGKILHFCSNKCEKNNFKLGRKARFLKWTGAFMKGTVKAVEKKIEEKAEEKTEAAAKPEQKEAATKEAAETKAAEKKQ